MSYDGLVVKRTFELPGPFRTAGGGTIERVRVGYETIGELDRARGNAILIPHPNLTSCHFAGRYARDDAEAGYWDAIAGPGKPLDTNRYFLVGVDSLCNVNVHDGVTVTTGPASIDPSTGKPYGMRFPIVQVRDLVEVQRAVLAHLGIERLHAVAGASFGSMQAFEWAAAHPEMVERVVAVVPSARVEAATLVRLREMRNAVMLDPNWNGGDYYGAQPPVAGLEMALRLLMAGALTPLGAAASYGRRWADPASDPAQRMDAQYAAAAWLAGAAKARAKVMDANHFLYVQKANELFAVAGAASLEEGLRAVRAPTLLVPAKGDDVLPEIFAYQVRDCLKAQGTEVELVEIAGSLGHYDGVFSIAQAGGAIERFLSR